METKTHIGLTHVFTNRTADSTITLKAGAGETLSIPSFQMTDATLSNLVVTSGTITNLNVTSSTINSLLCNSSINNGNSYIMYKNLTGGDLSFTTSTQGIATASWSTIYTNRFTSHPSNGSFTPSETGFYLINVNFQVIVNSASADVVIEVSQPGGTVFARFRWDIANVGNFTLSSSTHAYLTAGTYYSVIYYLGSGSVTLKTNYPSIEIIKI